MPARDRRLGFRVPLQIFLNKYIKDRPFRALTSNLSDTGIYLQIVKTPWMPEEHDKAVPVGLEFELPGTGEIIWARGEICYQASDDMVHGAGIRFTAMPEKYARMVRDYCVEARRSHLSDLLGRIRSY
jgi:hypothetical protein